MHRSNYMKLAETEKEPYTSKLPLEERNMITLQEGRMRLMKKS